MGNPLRDVSDADIDALSSAERRELVARLAGPLDEWLPDRKFLRRVRRLRLTVLSLCTVALVPWTVYLALTLPRRYFVEHWSATWVGFDVILVAFMGASVVLGVLRRLPVVLTSFTSGVLLLTDAWFDVMTARQSDLGAAIAAAVFAEIPLGLGLIAAAWWMMRIVAARVRVLDPHESLWSLRVE